MPQKKLQPVRRKKLTEATKTSVLVPCRRRCALCFFFDGDDSAKPQGQIAHIDRDRSNNSENNLAYLCLPHHDSYDSRPPQSTRLTPSELSFAKRSLLEYLALAGKRGSVEATITIQADSAQFTEADLQAFIASLTDLVKHKESIDITRVTKGSVKIDVRMDAEDVAMLMRELRRGRLEHMRVTSVAPKTPLHDHRYGFVEPFSEISHFSKQQTIKFFENSTYIADVPSADFTARLRACCHPSPGNADIAAIVLACITDDQIILTPPLIVSRNEVDEWACDRPVELLQAYLGEYGTVISQAGYPATKLVLNRQIRVSAFAKSILTLSEYIEQNLVVKDENARIFLIIRQHGDVVFVLVAYSLSVQEVAKQARLAKEVPWLK